jgi:hypothetical protein
MGTTHQARRRAHRRADIDNEPSTPADVVESLMLALLGLPLMVAFAKGAVHLSDWLLAHGAPFSALVGTCIAVAILGASLFGLLAAVCRRCAVTWSDMRRGG